MSSLLLGLAIFGGVLFLIDIIILAVYLVYCCRKRNEEKEESKPQTAPLIPVHPLKVGKPITQQTNVFRIPETIKPGQKSYGELDPDIYLPKTQRSLKGIPRVGFEFFYDFRTTQLKITLKGLKNIPKYFNEQVVVSILMSHSSIVYRSSKVECPDSIMDEEYPFPLESMEISSDPPITAKFNVWHIDKHSLRNAYGFVEVNIEEVLSETGIPTSSGSTCKTVWRNIIVSNQLTDHTQEGELLLTLSYLSAAQRIGVTIVKAKGLILTANDKDLHTKITLLCRGEEQNSIVTNYVELTQNPEFNQEFVFRFADFRSTSIDSVAIRIELVARQIGILDKPRILGHCYVGNSNQADRCGKEHWVTMLTSPKTVTNWHVLLDPSSKN